MRRFLADEPIQARRIGPFERLGRWGRRNPLVASLSAAIVLVTALGFIGVLGQWRVALANEHQANANGAEAKEKEREASQQRDEARALAEKLQAALEQLRRTTYTAQMNLARHAWEEGATDQMVELLEQQRPKPGETDLRGFEWYYLNRLRHAEILTLKGHTGRVLSVAYSPDGKRLASASYDKTVKVWDAQTGQELLSLKDDGRFVAFSPDGKRLAGGSKVWDAQTGQELLQRGGVFSPDGKRLAGVSKVWDAQTGQELLSLQGGGRIQAFSPDGKRLASGGSYSDQTVKIWDAQTGQEILTLKGAHGSLAFSPDGKRLANGAYGGTVKVWDVQTGQQLLSFKGHIRGLLSVAFSPDGKRLATQSDYGTVKVWDAQTGQETLTLKGGLGHGVVFSPDGHRLAGAGERGLKIWDATPLPEKP